MDLTIYVDGEFVLARSGVGLDMESEMAWPNGVFESLRTYNGKIYRFKEHWLRLLRSSSMIQLEVPITRENLKKAIHKTMAKNGLKEAYIRVSLTESATVARGATSSASIQILTKSLPQYSSQLIEKGVAVITATTRKNPGEALPPQIKSSNFLPNVLARIEADLKDAPFEAIMLNERGFLAEGTISNIFIVKDEVLFTPPGYLGLLEGITRAVVMKLAQEEGIIAKEEVLARVAIYTADEAFLTFTSMGILPIVKADGRDIGDGLPGKTTKRLIAAYERDTQA